MRCNEMNYKPNKIDWRIGDIVIHDANAKEGIMLMKVIIVEPIGITTQYIDKEKYGDQYYLNNKKYLHDPKGFKFKTKPGDKQ